MNRQEDKDKWPFEGKDRQANSHINASMTDSDSLLRLQRATSTWRVAIVHDWLVTNGGAEKVLESLLAAFPQADLFTLIDTLPANRRGWLGKRSVTTSVLQRLPFAKRHYRHFLPLMPFAVEQFDVGGYDIVLTSSYAVAKGVVTHPGQTHICYCHTPIRYAWDMKEQYLADAGFRLAPLEWIARYLLHRIRQWDYFTASQVDHFWANSENIARRIKKYYRRDSEVLYPPVAVEGRTWHEGARSTYYLAASRLVPYKRLDLVIETFMDMPDRRLIVIGDGPERERLERMAAGFENIDLLGFCEDSELQSYLEHARGFIFAAEEDFGILPLEAQASGTPVIAYAKGGALETVRSPLCQHDDEATGLFFEEQTKASLSQAIQRFETLEFSSLACRRNAERFAENNFWDRIHCLLVESGLIHMEPHASDREFATSANATDGRGPLHS